MTALTGQEARNLETTQSLFTAFGEQNVPQILTHLDPACVIEFSSAWLQRHSSNPLPASAAPAQRGQPPSLQLRTPRGVPL